MKTKLVLLLLVTLKFANSFATPPVDEGKRIFTSRCAACHNVNKDLTGPALAGVDKRRTIDWIVKFVNSSQTLVKSGDKDAVALFEKFNRIPMPDHPDLTKNDIHNIVEYINANTVVAEKKAAPFKKPGKLHPHYKPISIEKDSWFFYAFLGSVGLLIAGLLLLVNVQNMRIERQFIKSETAIDEQNHLIPELDHNLG